MNIFLIISIILLVLYVLIGVVVFLLSPNFIYMFLFEHKEWKMWRFFKKNINNFVFDKESYELLKTHINADVKYFIWDNYKAVVWGCSVDPFVSIHDTDDNQCICSPFWKSQAKSFAKKLLENNVN